METLTQEQKLVKYAEQNNCENLPIKVSENITKIRKLFADVIKIRDSYNVQMKKLINACENNDIEFVNSDVFGDEAARQQGNIANESIRLCQRDNDRLNCR